MAQVWGAGAPLVKGEKAPGGLPLGLWISRLKLDTFPFEPLAEALRQSDVTGAIRNVSCRHKGKDNVDPNAQEQPETGPSEAGTDPPFHGLGDALSATR
ncbi:hypothetical protein MASR1M49_25630 [Pararhodobacter aggregans]